MTDIEDRDVTFKSWKAYAMALKAEVSCLQQFLPPEHVEAGFRAFERASKRRRLRDERRNE